MTDPWKGGHHDVEGRAPAVTGRGRVVAAIGAGQTLAWASSYYLPAIVAAPMAREFGLPPSAVFGAFSAALLLTAALGPAVGRAVDRRGGRGVLVLSAAVLAAGLVILALAPSAPVLFLGWAVLGAGMALGLYDPAFATLAGIYGRDARGAITGITLIAGFASTLGWPLTTWLTEAVGWRGACLGWAALLLTVAAPLYRFLVPPAPPPAPSAAEALPEEPPPRRALALVALAMAGTAFNAAAMAAHLPGTLLLAGASPAAALLAASLVGPMQVAARLVEFGLLGRVHPLMTGRLAAAAHPLAVGLVWAGAAPALLAILHGAANGMLTIVRGTLPLALFGPNGYGARQGVILAPARLLQAVTPFAFGLALDRAGLGALWLLAGVGAVSLGALLALRPRPA